METKPGSSAAGASFSTNFLCGANSSWMSCRGDRGRWCVWRRSGTFRAGSVTRTGKTLPGATTESFSSSTTGLSAAARTFRVESTSCGRAGLCAGPVAASARVAFSSLFVVHLNLDGGFYLVSQLDVFALYLRCIVTAHAAVSVGYVFRPCNAPSNSFSAPLSRLLLSAPTEQTKSRVLLRGRWLGLSWRLTQPRLTTPGCFLCLCAMLRRAQVPAPSTTIRLLLIASASSC